MTYPSKDIDYRDFIALEGQLPRTKESRYKVSMKKHRKPFDISIIFIVLLTR